MSGTGKFPYPGAIDADGHVLEPPDMWEKYIDPQFRDRAIRLRPNKDGLEMLEIGGRPSKFMIPGGLTFAGAMGKPIEEQVPSPERTYANTAPFVAPYTIPNKAHAHPDYDRFWSVAQDLDLPIGIHPCAEPPAKRVHQRFKDMQKWAMWHFNVHGGQGPLQAFTALFQYGLFERFPTVKVIVLESGAGWAGYLLNRMDAVSKTSMGRNVRLKELPSYYFQRQCWISGDPDEKAFGHIIDFVGADKFFWASDFPHPDHPGDYMEELAELVAPLSEDSRRKVLGENVKPVYGL